MRPVELEQKVNISIKALCNTIDLLSSLGTEALQDLTVNRVRELISGMRKPLYILEDIGQDIMNIAILNDMAKAHAAAAPTGGVTRSSAVEMLPPTRRKCSKQQVVGKKAVGFED
jgi:hypothetical protein